MGLAGIRSIYTVFDEVYGKNKGVKLLADSPQLSPFEPPLLSQSWKETPFVREEDQRALIKLWRSQLERFRESLC
jgi:hypothetical protein